MSAPERREPQSEAALDSRPPSLRSLLSLPTSSSLSVRGPLHTLSRSPPAPTSPHRHPPPSCEGDRSLSFFLSRSGPTIRPQPQPLPLPPTLSLSTVSAESHPRQSLGRHLSSSTAVISSSSTSLSLSLAYLRLLTTFTLISVSAPPCQFLCETTNGAVRYLPT